MYSTKKITLIFHKSGAEALHNKGNEPRKNYQKYYRNSIRLAPDYRRAGRILGFRFKLQASRLGFWCTWITKQNERERESFSNVLWKVKIRAFICEFFFFFFLNLSVGSDRWEREFQSEGKDGERNEREIVAESFNSSPCCRKKTPNCSEKKIILITQWRKRKRSRLFCSWRARSFFFLHFFFCNNSIFFYFFSKVF